MPLRRSQVHALDVVVRDRDSVPLDLRVGSGTYVRSIADVLGGHCTTLRRLEVGPSPSTRPTRAVIPADEALARGLR